MLKANILEAVIYPRRRVSCYNDKDFGANFS